MLKVAADRVSWMAAGQGQIRLFQRSATLRSMSANLGGEKYHTGTLVLFSTAGFQGRCIVCDVFLKNNFLNKIIDSNLILT